MEVLLEWLVVLFQNQTVYLLSSVYFLIPAQKQNDKHPELMHYYTYLFPDLP